MKAIVYKSNTGHTLQYAKMLSEKLGIPYYSIKEVKRYLKQDDEIIYLGWIFASKICGLNKIRNKYQVKCCAGVGVYPEGEEYIQSLKNTNKVNEPLFYLRGGIDYTKLKGIKRKLLQMVGNAIEQENKPENKEMIEMFKKGANFVSEKNLDKMLEYVQNS